NFGDDGRRRAALKLSTYVEVKRYLEKQGVLAALAPDADRRHRHRGPRQAAERDRAGQERRDGRCREALPLRLLCLVPRPIVRQGQPGARHPLRWAAEDPGRGTTASYQ